MAGGPPVGNRKDSVVKESEEQPVTTKSGRASKPSTPAIPSFPESVRARSSRNTIDSNKRSHKKGAGAAAQLLAAQVPEPEDGPPDEVVEEDVDVDDDEPRYCYCNGVSFGEMVGCDGDSCVREWFHLGCVGLKVAPKGNCKFFVSICR